jgi:hypothetical protein
VCEGNVPLARLTFAALTRFPVCGPLCWFQSSLLLLVAAPPARRFHSRKIRHVQQVLFRTLTTMTATFTQINRDRLQPHRPRNPAFDRQFLPVLAQSNFRASAAMHAHAR